MSSPDALPQSEPDAGQSCRIFPADAFVVDHGLNEGDSLGGPDVDCPGDVFRLAPGARARQVVLSPAVDPFPARVRQGSDIGRPGDPVTVEAHYTLAARNGARVTLAMVRIGRDLRGAVPLHPFDPRGRYTLLHVTPPPLPLPLGLPLCPLVARGTRVALACGTLRPVEDLRPGDMLATAGAGSLPLRWIGRTALPGMGDLAPVEIVAEVLGNARDLIVGPDLPILPEGPSGAGRAVAARGLVGRAGLRRRETPVVEYFALVLDRPATILVEGIAVESLTVTPALLLRLPEDLARDLCRSIPGLVHVAPPAEAPTILPAILPAPAARPR